MSKKENFFIDISSGESLLAYLKTNGMNIEKFSGIEGAKNAIYLPDKTTFNWKNGNK